MISTYAINNMPKSNIKYELTRNDEDTNSYLLQRNTFQNVQTIQEKSIFWTDIVKISVILATYFVLSVGLTFYQQWLYRDYEFNFPLTVVSCHLVIKFLISYFILYLRECCKLRQQIKLSWRTIIWTLGPPGIASGLDIGFSNLAISLITISLYTMTKSTSVIFILGFALLLKLEKKSWSLVGIVGLISGGLLMFTYKSTQFHLVGFSFCLMASFLSGIRWTVTQLILQRSKIGLKDPVDMMYYMQPWMLLSVLPFSIWFEGANIFAIFKHFNWIKDSSSALTTTIAVVAGAFLAFSMEIMEYLVVTYGSSLTLTISGVVKEICMLFLGYKWHGDQILNGFNFVGLLMCFAGIILHVVKKITLVNKAKLSPPDLETEDSSFSINYTNPDQLVDDNTIIPLLKQKYPTNNGSSDEEELYNNDNSKQILNCIIQRREYN